MIINFLVLACSYKHGGRCVAGIDLDNKQMIRLISRDEATKGAIPKEWCKMVGNIMIKPLDVLEINILEKAPTVGAQSENYYVESGFILSKKREGTIAEIKPYIDYSDKRKQIYPFGSKSSFISKDEYLHKDKSLCIIVAYVVRGFFKEVGEDKKCKITFNVYSKAGPIELSDYSVTDPAYCFYETEFCLGKAYLVVSMAQDTLDSGLCYKFVSSILEVDKNDNYTNKEIKLKEFF